MVRKMQYNNSTNYTMLTVIVPYRDREAHLQMFMPAVYKYLNEHLDCDFEILIIEQIGGMKFNRAKLLNVGALNADPSTRYFCFHDVDHLPLKVDYSYSDKVTQLVKSNIQPIGYLGGVTLFPDDVFFKIGGYSNNFWGWGGEDNEIANLVPEINNRFGMWNILDHKKNGTFDIVKWQQSKQPRSQEDGIFKTTFEIRQQVIMPGYNLRHYWVEL